MEANEEDCRILTTVAGAFRAAEASGAAICHASDGQVQAALDAAGIATTRDDLAVDLHRLLRRIDEQITLDAAGKLADFTRPVPLAWSAEDPSSRCRSPTDSQAPSPWH